MGSIIYLLKTNLIFSNDPMFDHLTSGIFEKPSLDKFRLIISLALFKSFSVIKNFIFFRFSDIWF